MIFDERARDTLSQPVIVRLTTIRPDGYPHTTPVWFILEGDDLLVFATDDTQKIRNLRGNPKASLTIGGDPVDSPCYLIDGDVILHPDPDQAVAARITRHYETPEKAREWLDSWKDLTFLTLRLNPRRVVKVS
jgi:PPOX class probable F420-dependent enzyme